MFNSIAPETVQDYRATLAGIPIPTLSYEVGQWLVYPDFTEIGAYTGVLQARNLEAFRASLRAHHMLDQAGDFVRASGTLSLLLYCEEIERSFFATQPILSLR